MARIVGIHGIGHQVSSGPQLAEEWWPAIVGGLEAAGRQEEAAGLGRADVRVVFFGSLFREPSVRLAAASRGAPGDPAGEAPVSDDGDEAELIREFYREAVWQDVSAERGTGRPTLAALGVQEMLARLLKSPTFADVAQSLFVGNLRQATAYLNDPKVRDQAMARAAKEIQADTRVLIGHSLGSVVAYELLATGRYPQVGLLLTAGSPLGIPNVVFDKLLPAPVNGKGSWPGAVARWVNLADRHDVVALVKRLAPLFPAPAGFPPLEDYRVDNGHSPHDAAAYLNADVAGRAIGEALSAPTAGT
ncbi:hypothetical protein GCM10023081_24340 [Arthrobacter ginkgonis]|uniref:Alpha/beta hydrolase n=1 Tax=Arthrobacter ginkgonis TaxID=1630594 RepID=A0ABP7CEN6_9MICC